MSLVTESSEVSKQHLHDHHTSISISGRPLCNLRFADDIDHMGGSNGELQDLTNRLVDRATAYGMEVSAKKEQDHDQQHEQRQCSYQHERREVRGGDRLKEPGNKPVQGRHRLSRNSHYNCLSNGSNGQTKQDLVMQHHQLHKQVQVLAYSEEKDPGFRNQVPEESSSHFLLGA